MQVVQRSINRSLADFSRQHFTHTGSQRQGEVAVAAVQLQQIVRTFAQRFIGPIEHLLVDRAVWLGERAFRLLISEGATRHLQLLDHMIAANHRALALGTANHADIKVLGQLLGCGLPLLVQRAVIAQSNHRIAGQGGLELHLEQFVAQRRAGLPGSLELGHQLIDAQAGNREVFDQDRRALVILGEHGVVTLAPFAPQTELGPQTEVLQRRIEHLRLRRIEWRQQLAQTVGLGFKLNGVGSRIERQSTHALNQPSLTTNRTDRMISGAFSSRARPDSSLITVQEIKPKAMPLAME